MRSLQPDHSLFNWSSNPPGHPKKKKMKNKHHHPHWGIKTRSSVSFLLRVKGLKPDLNQLSPLSVLRSASSRGRGSLGGRSHPSLQSRTSRRSNVSHPTPGAPTISTPQTPRTRSRSSRRQSPSPPGVSSPATHTSRRDTPRTARRSQLRCRNLGCPDTVIFSSRRALERHERMTCPTLTQV